MNANDIDPNKGRRLKVIVATIVAAVVILFVGIWAISSALNSGKKNNGETKPAEVAKTSEKNKEKTEQTGTKPNSPSEQYTPTTAQPAETTPAVEPAQSSIPTTGPAEVLFSAVMLGVVATLVTLNVQLVKENQ